VYHQSMGRKSKRLGRHELSQSEFKLILHGSVLRKPVVERFYEKNEVTHREPVALPKGVHYR